MELSRESSGASAQPGPGGRMAPPDGHVLRVCALYPDLMNIYADRGNLMVLARRCAWRGIGFQLSVSSLGESLDGSAYDLFYIGGGQDRDQRLCAHDLAEHKHAGLHEAARRGAVVLGVCGGYQLLGHSYALDGVEMPGVGLLDVHTLREPGPRLIGNIAIEVRLADPNGAERDAERSPDRQSPARVLAGFENHGGRTYLGEQSQPLGRVLKGHGNDGHSGFEGARQRNVIGTYLHGPLLPKNAWLADWLIATCLSLDPGSLARLDDTLELAAHSSARRAAGLPAA